MTRALARLYRYLRDRKLAGAIVLLALAAALLQGLLWWIAPSSKVSDFVGPPRSGYTLTHFRMWSYDLQGRPNFSMTSPRLDRREGDDSLYITTPQFTLASKTPGTPDWDGHSLYGWVNHQGTLLKLQGPVHLHRPAYAGAHGTTTAETVIDTADVTAWPKENRMETAAPAQITQGDSRMNGIGMRANLNDNELELLDDSHGTFPPRKRRS